jgi:tripartite-type tricarboxylate transporter receptor subunit TctC
MRLHPRSILLALCLALTQAALAQNYPNRPIKIVVPFPPGGGSDPVARIVGAKVSESLGQPVVIENRPGANGTVGNEFVAKAAPDGYTLLLGAAGSLTVAPHVYKKVQFDTFKDFEPISLAGTVPFILAVNPNVPANTLPELTAYAKANHGRLNFGSSGTGGLPHLAGEIYKRMAGVEIVHVPYKGGGPAITGLLTGDVQILFSDVGLMVPLLKAGKIKAIAVTSEDRSAAAPDVPTMKESGLPEYQVSTWWGFLAPAGTPRPIIDVLNAEVRKALTDPDVKQRFAAMWVDTAPTTTEQFAARMRRESDKWAQVVKDAKVEAE